MVSNWGLLALALWSAQGTDPASGQSSLGYCYWQDHYNGPTRAYLTDVFRTNLTEAQAKAQWLQYTEEKYGLPPPRTGVANCNLDNPEDLAKARSYFEGFSPDGWVPQDASTSDETKRITGSVKKPLAGIGLVVEENTSARDAAVLAEKRLMESRKAEAAKKAQMIAASAASKAESQRIMAKVKAEMKKRGRKQ